MAVRLPCFAAVLCNIIPSDDLSPSPGGLKESNVGNMYKKLDKTDNISIILSITFQYGEGNKIVFDEICNFFYQNNKYSSKAEYEYRYSLTLYFCNYFGTATLFFYNLDMMVTFNWLKFKYAMSSGNYLSNVEEAFRIC